jgi:hypothetical protein
MVEKNCAVNNILPVPENVLCSFGDYPADPK